MVVANMDSQSPALICLKPRQVMLEKQNSKNENKNKKDKEKKKKKNENNNEDKGDSSSETLEATTPHNDNEKEEFKKKEKSKKHKNKKSKRSQIASFVLQSVASYLETKGFSKTLSSLRSEASLETDGLESQSLDLEAVFGKYLETSEFSSEANANDMKEQGPHKDLLAERDLEPVSKKKKKSIINDTNTETIKNLTNGITTEHKEKKDKVESKKSNTHADSTVQNNLSEETHEKSGKKKKKSNTTSDSLGEDIKEFVSETLQQASETAGYELPKKSKGKRLKDKLTSDNPSESFDKDKLEAPDKVTKEKSSSLPVPESVSQDGGVVPTKAKKKEKAKSFSIDIECPGDETIADNKREDVLATEENTKAIEKKGSKKRKRPATGETDSMVDDKVASKGQEANTIDGTKDKKAKKEKHTNNVSVESEGQGKPSKKRKAEKNENGIGKQLDEQHEASMGIKAEHSSKKGLDGLANGNTGKKENGGASLNASEKNERNGSAEPKTVKAFQRVKIDEVKFADERLQDNSYWAKDGAESGYGAKAQEVLGQVRGRDFRHEKTKKKRGTYRGGQIDFQSHSIKFQNSDDEE